MTAADVAARLNLRRSPRGWRGSCPACGYADAFALQAVNEQIKGWCASCGDTSGIRSILASLQGGTDYVPPVNPPRKAMSDAERAERALRAWSGAVRCLGTPAATYLARRGLPHLVASPSLRWRPDVTHPEVPGPHAAMLALVVGPGGAQALHRTYPPGTAARPC